MSAFRRWLMLAMTGPWQDLLTLLVTEDSDYVVTEDNTAAIRVGPEWGTILITMEDEELISTENGEYVYTNYLI